MLALEHNDETERVLLFFFNVFCTAVQSPKLLFVLVRVLVGNLVEGVAIFRLARNFHTGACGGRVAGSAHVRWNVSSSHHGQLLRSPEQPDT